MNDFLSITFSYPTIIFAVLLGLACVYWAIVMIGGIGFDGLDGAVDGVAEGAGEGALEGVAEGVAEGATEGAAEAAGDASADAASHGLGMLASVLNVLRLRDIPMTFVMSLVCLWAWMLSQVTVGFVRPLWSGVTGPVGGSLVLLGSFVLAWPITSIVVRPLAHWLRPSPATRRTDFIGQIVEISTATVEPEFGVARLEDGGAGHILEVRCEAGKLNRGDRALVVSYDADREVFEVAAVRDMLPSEVGEDDSGGSPSSTR